MAEHFFKYVITHGGKIKMLKGDFSNSLGISNPSILKHNDKFYMSFRSCEYTFMNFHYNNIHDYSRRVWFPMALYTDIPCNYVSYYHICDYDPTKMEISNPRHVFEDREKRDLFYNGAEDVRLWHDKDNNIAMSFSMFEQDGKISMNFSSFDDDFNEIKTIKHNIEYTEKNWMPIDGKPEWFVRKPFSNIVHGYDGLEHIGAIESPLNYRGSTNLCEYDGGYICLVHGRTSYKVDEKYTDFNYVHKFICLDKDFNIIKESDWFMFTGLPIEFTCGMTIENDELILPMCVFDSTSFVIKIGLEQVFAYINNIHLDTKLVGTDASNAELHQIILKSSQQTLPMLICEYIVKHNNNSKAAMIACKSQIAALTKIKEKQIIWYVDAMREIKKFDFGMQNKFMHMLIGEDMIRDCLDKLLDS